MKKKTGIKVAKIKEVRSMLSGMQDNENSWIEQRMYVSTWLNSFSKEGQRLLEVGCGEALIRGELKVEYHGVDPIRHERLVEDFPFYLCTADQLKSKNKFFDYILIKDSINYFQNIESLFQNILPLLKPGGKILITEYVGKHYSPIIQGFKNFIKKYLKIKTNIWDKTYLNFYSSKNILSSGNKLFLKSKYAYNKQQGRYYIIIRP
jgi:ubiquinone/menaquinone biosynthesis C-methylase UbiE